jgi:transposase InsO family protein
VKYAAIADWAADKQFSVTFMCARLGVVRQGYYRWLAEGPCERERTDAELTETIREIHAQLHGHPGVRRVWAELVARGLRVARKRIWRLMRAAGLQGRHPRAWKRTTVAGQRPIDAADLIGQDFTAEQPDTRWCGDITYAATVDGWVYTATVIDLHSRKVVGYAVADHLRTSLIVEALAAALVSRRPARGVIFHSDRGSTPPGNSPTSAPKTVSSGRWAAAPPASIMRSPSRSSRRTRRSLSTSGRGTTSPRCDSTHSCGSRATTTDGGDTPHSAT